MNTIRKWTSSSSKSDAAISKVYVSGPRGKAAAPGCRLFLEFKVRACSAVLFHILYRCIYHSASPCLFRKTVALQIKFSANIYRLKLHCKQKHSHAPRVTPPAVSKSTETHFRRRREKGGVSGFLKEARHKPTACGYLSAKDISTHALFQLIQQPFKNILCSVNVKKMHF